ncbi:MAG: hypothetical protein HYT12_02180 [Candidatus Liptonbacteria bacterium]|nr:hypothetical protein [Candidatus Liptonbacteria bacterium]
MEIALTNLLRKYRWFIGGVVTSAVLVSVVIVYNSPDFYDAHAKIYSGNASVLGLIYETLNGEEIERAVFKENADLADTVFGKKIVYDYSTNIIIIRIRSENPNISARLANLLSEKTVQFYPNFNSYRVLAKTQGLDRALEGLPIITERAAVPNNPAGPARLPIVVTTALISFAGVFLLAGIKEHLQSV